MISRSGCAVDDPAVLTTAMQHLVAEQKRYPMTPTKDSSTSNSLVQTGDKAPDFGLHTLGGQPFSLSDTLRKGRNVLLVFLRHLG